MAAGSRLKGEPLVRVIERSQTTAQGSRFYTGMAIAAMLTVLVGFARTYFLKAFTGAPALPLSVHVHAVVFCAWLVLFLAQTRLVAMGRSDLHRKLGALGVALAALVLIVGYYAALGSVRRGFRGIFDPAAPGTSEARAFSILGFVDLLMFLGFVAAGLYFRSKPEIHKRLMVLSTINLLDAAFPRFPLGVARPPVAFAVLIAFLAAGPVHDRLTRGRIHPVNLWGGLLVLLSGPLRVAFGTTAAWQQFVIWLIR